jgi:glucan phosphoethanolaminetransferase (alkaline phosphatase superfamily)
MLPVMDTESLVDTVFGLPVHPLVVHAAVVLIPLSALLVIAIAIVPRWRQGVSGWFTVGLTAVATAAVPVATQSGEALAERVGEPERHTALGEAMIYFMAPLLLLALALVLLSARDRRRAGTEGLLTPRQSVLTLVVAIASVVAAVAATVQVAFVGHSGATATWAPIVASTSAD